MRLRYIPIILTLALLLMANSALATTCAVFAMNDHKMTVNNAKIYIDDSAQPIGTTTYNSGFGQYCWIGDINLNGAHTFSAKWVQTNPNRVLHEGSIVVELAGEKKKLIRIPTHKA
jgi:hypothetical protein